MPKASARHILVKTEEACIDLKSKIEGGADFADMAKQHSECPSGNDGGGLGEFSPGQMVPEFDTVVLMMMWEKFMVRLKLNSDTILLRSPAEANRRKYGNRNFRGRMFLGYRSSLR